MPRVDDRALILRGYPYSDTSRILKLFCERYGLQTVIAKGAMRPRSRFGGILEPFTEGRVQFHLQDGREMHTLSAFELLRSRQSLGRNLVSFAGASLLAELALRFTTTEADPELFHLLVRELDRLGSVDEDGAPATALAAVWQLVARLGFEPRLDACVGCGRPVGPDEPSRFDVEAGGVACTLCRPQGRMVDARTRGELGRMCEGVPAAEAGSDWGLHRALLRAFVSAHLSAERPLRSLELFVDLLPRQSGPAGGGANAESSTVP